MNAYPRTFHESGKNYCQYCNREIPAKRKMCRSAPCRREHNQTNADKRWQHATPEDKQAASLKMNSTKSPEKRKAIALRAGVASGKLRHERAMEKRKLYTALKKKLIDRILRDCLDVPFTLTKNNRLLSKVGRYNMIESGRRFGSNQIDRLLKPDKGFRSYDEHTFFRKCEAYAVKISYNEPFNITLPYLHYGHVISWNPDYTIISNIDTYFPDEDHFPDGTKLLVETKGLGWLHECEKRFKDTRRKLPERLAYLRQLRELCIKYYERFLCNRRLFAAGLQAPVFWISRNAAKYIDKDTSVMHTLDQEHQYVIGEIIDLMHVYCYAELETLEDCILFSPGIDLSTEENALQDIADILTLEPEFADPAEQDKRLIFLAKDYLPNALSFNSPELRDRLAVEQAEFNNFHDTDFDIDIIGELVETGCSI
jgi:hypothetical protein